MPQATTLALLTGCASRPAKPSAQAPPPAAHPAQNQISQDAAAKPSLPFEGEGWEPMFDGKTLAGWRETQFAGRGEVQCKNRMIVLNMGDPFTGIGWTNDFPKMNYEVALDAMRVSGSDFFCGLTVPVGDTFCSLIVGGLAPGGVNFDAKVRRESFEPVDLFHAHIGGMDAFAHGLKIAARIRKDGVLKDFIKQRYASWDSGIGKQIESGQARFADLEKYILDKGQITPNTSGRQEMLENVINRYLR